LLPNSAKGGKHNEVSSVDKVILCKSEVLHFYSKNSEMKDYIKGIESFYKLNKDQSDFKDSLLKTVDSYIQPSSSVVSLTRRAPPTIDPDRSFHHIMTEMAFLEIRAQGKVEACDSIIPVVLNGPPPSDKFQIWVGLSDVSECWVLHQNQILHKAFFRILKRIFEELGQFISAFEGCYDDCVTGLLAESSSSLPSEQHFERKVVHLIMNTLKEVVDDALATYRTS